MERHSINDASAFEMLRRRSRTANRKLVDVAAAVVAGLIVTAFGLGVIAVTGGAHTSALRRYSRADCGALASRPSVCASRLHDHSLAPAGARPARF